MQMPRYLVTLSFGPVQSLIEAARRTRDLWCGSWLLSESARAAARVLHERAPGGLIFPCPIDPETALLPQSEPGDSANIANVLRAEVELPDAAGARLLCERAKTAAAERLAELAEQARRTLRAPLREDVWQAQVHDLLEGFAAWAEIPQGAAGYQRAGATVGEALAARKATRDFAPTPSLIGEGLRKSSLDGALETVLPEHWREQHRARRKLVLSRGEQLDVLGVAKRLAGDPEQFTAYSRIAADSWIRNLMDEQLERIRGAYEPLVEVGLATRVSGNGREYARLPYDAQLLFHFRLDNALSGRDADTPDGEDRAKLQNLHRTLRPIWADAGAPVPYAVLLKADGDRMGALLRKATTAEDARAISRDLHGFADNVRALVRRHHGHAIYSGGDDVLALVPLADAIACAEALRIDFRDRLRPVAERLGLPSAERPTLSVGLGIGHLMEPLGSLRARAGRAEHLAKGDKLPATTQRNALAILLGVRCGAETSWRAQWDPTEPLDALRDLISAYREEQLPSRAAYDLRLIDRRLAWLAADNSDTARGIRRSEVARMLDRARTENGSKALSTDVRGLILRLARSRPLSELADSLLMARWLSARTAADLGERQ